MLCWACLQLPSPGQWPTFHLLNTPQRQYGCPHGTATSRAPEHLSSRRRHPVVLHGPQHGRLVDTWLCRGHLAIQSRPLVPIPCVPSERRSTWTHTDTSWVSCRLTSMCQPCANVMLTDYSNLYKISCSSIFFFLLSKYLQRCLYPAHKKLRPTLQPTKEMLCLAANAFFLTLDRPEQELGSLIKTGVWSQLLSVTQPHNVAMVLQQGPLPQ